MYDNHRDYDYHMTNKPEPVPDNKCLEPSHDGLVVVEGGRKDELVAGQAGVALSQPLCEMIVGRSL